MKKVIFLLLLLSFMGQANERREALLNVLDQELHEIVRLNKQVGGRRPDLMLRMAELFLEKARVIKERENEEYLKVNQKDRDKINKKKAFSESRKHFNQAQKTCETILSKFKNFSSKADVYYIMAYNSKELGQSKKARKYFKFAVKSSSKGSAIDVKSKIALAELYFINGQFQSAIPLYEKTLSKKRDKWWTKDSYNLAWCYYRTGKAEKAIALLRQVHKYSKNSKFVDMSLNVERDLAYFYAETGNAKEAINFYKDKSGDLVGDLLRISEHLTTKGKYTAAEKMLQKASAHTKKTEQKIEIYLRLMELYEKFGRYDNHLTIAKKMKPFLLKSEIQGIYLERYIYQIKKLSAKLQKQVVGKLYQHRAKVRTKKMKMAAEYFSILVIAEPSQAYRSYFHLAETYYANKWFQSALKFYDLSLRKAKEKNNSEYQKLALDGLMAILSMKGIKNKDKYMEYAYISYLNKNPRGKRSYALYQRLFKRQLKNRKIKEAEETLAIFRKRYPKSQKKHEAMIAEIMEYHRISKNTSEIKRWIGMINNGQYVVSKGYAKKLHELLLSIEFESVEKASAEGNKKEALRGYLKIYTSPRSTALAKKQAAYNIAILFHQLQDVRRTYDWAMKSLALMDVNDAVQFRGEYILMATEMFNRQQFSKAESLYSSYFKKTCKAKLSRKDIILKNTVVVYLANSKLDAALDLVAYGATCGVPQSKIEDLQFDIAKVAISKKQWSLFEMLEKELEKKKKNRCRLIMGNGALGEEYSRKGKKQLAAKKRKKMMSYYAFCKKRKFNVDVESLDYVAFAKIERLKDSVENLRRVRLSYPEKIYNAKLKLLFTRLDAITTSAIEILKIGSGRGIVTTYKILVENYRFVVKQMRSFIPPGKSPQYIQSFRKSMVKLSSPILIKSNEFYNAAKRQIEQNEILSNDNAWFMKAPQVPISVEYVSDDEAVIMDRGGVK